MRHLFSSVFRRLSYEADTKGPEGGVVAPTPPSIKGLVKEIKELRLARNLENALASAEIAIARYPKNVNARIALAEVLIDLGKLADAVPHLRLVLSMDPLERRARQKLKRITGSFNYTLDAVENTLAGADTRPGVYLRAAEYLNEGSLFADAARIAQTGLDKLTDEERTTGIFESLLFQLAFALEGMQDFDKAITIYDRLPVDQQIRRKAADHARELGRIIKEIKQLRRACRFENAYAKAEIAVAQYPGNVNARIALADVLIDLGRSADAEPHLRLVLSMDPLENRARQKLKLITGSYNYTLDAVENALAGADTRPGVYLRAAEYLNEGSLFADAARIAQTGIDKLTDEERATDVFGGLLFQLAFALESTQDFDEAITIYACIPVDHPIRRKAASHHARCLLELGRIKEAETVLDAVGARFGGAMPHNAVLLPLLYLKQEIGKAHMTYRYRATSRAIQEYFRTGLEPTEICIASGAYREKNALLISEGGPGDEIRFAATYGRLASLFRSLSVTCDPRLDSLMERSFPDITFVPVRRHRNEILPATIHDRTRVNDRRLISFINDRVIDAAANADLICSMLDTLGEIRAVRSDFRAGSRITPRADLKDIWRSKTEAESGSRMKVGLAWRSMLQSNSRDRHYLRIHELEALGEIQDVDFWVLQPNATDEELKALSSFVRICIPSGLDLVDDFEGQAALISNMDAVIAPLTTTAELAGMLGATTVILSRTHLTTWRANPDESDVWYESGRVVTGTPVWDADTLVEKVVSQIENIRGTKTNT